jgi:hypothetical protein
MKAYESVDVYIHIFLTWALVVRGQLHALVLYPQGKGP